MKYFIVDAFTDTIFKGNPAGICLLEEDLDSEIMQSIATENNLSETAFILKCKENYNLRWFTPEREVDLCGHATLASAFVITNFIDTNSNEIQFETKSGMLLVEKKEDVYVLNFPANQLIQKDVTAEMEQAIGTSILEAYVSHDLRNLVLLLKNEQQVRNVVPDFDKVKLLVPHAVTVTAKGEGVDFVSRYFAPNGGIMEDPVTGASHTRLIPFWAERLGKDTMVAEQLSKRGGVIFCENCGDRVKMSGRAALYLKGEIFID